MRSTPAAFLASCALLALLSGCKPKQASEEQAPTTAQETAMPSQATEQTAPPTELAITDVKVGEGPAIAAGKTAVVHYTGWLYDAAAADNKGSKFDSSRDSGKGFEFKLGEGMVIQGWDRGVAGMQVGGQRRLVIPPGLAYGERGTPGGPIPPNATLVFDVELLEAK